MRSADGIFFGDISALAAQVRGARGANEEAVIFFPASIADEVIARATRIVEQESYERDLVRKKQHCFRDVYPLNPELRKQFEEEKKRKP